MTNFSRDRAMFARLSIFLAAFLTLSLSFAGAAAADQAKPGVDEFIVSEAQSFENTLQTTWPTKGKDAKGWLAEAGKAAAKDEHRAAAGYLRLVRAAGQEQCKGLAQTRARVSRHRDR